MTDAAVVERLWTSEADRFFPDGRRGAAVLELHIETAEWWESEGTVRRLVHLVKSLVGDDRAETGRHGLIDLTQLEDRRDEGSGEGADSAGEEANAAGRAGTDVRATVARVVGSFPI